MDEKNILENKEQNIKSDNTNSGNQNNHTIEQSISERLRQTAAAANGNGESQPVGTSIEDEMKRKEAQANQPKKKRGAKKGSHWKWKKNTGKEGSESNITEGEDYFEDEKPTVDQFTRLANVLLLMYAKKKDLDVKEVAFTEDELLEISKLCPKGEESKPSWITWIAALAIAGYPKIAMATDKKQTEELEQLKKQFAEMQKAQNPRQARPTAEPIETNFTEIK